MNQQKLANGLRQLGEAVYEIADALLDDVPASLADAGRPEAAAPTAAVPATTYEASPFEPDEFNQQTGDFGSEAVCPKHRIPYTEGTYGPYCKQATDDPAWGKQKGDRLWCKITPKNAAEYLRIRAAA